MTRKAIDNPELSELLCRELHAEDFESVIGLIDAHTAAAVAAEREACADRCGCIADMYTQDDNRGDVAVACAKIIRARGEYE